MNYKWNWGVFFQQTPDGDAFYWEWILSGLAWTLAVSAVAWVIAVALGSVIGVIRTTERPWLVRLGNAWVELFRNIPLLVQMFLWYFVVPEFVPPLKGWMTSTEPIYAQFLSAILCLGLFTSARIAEQVRAGVQSLPRGQRMAGRALGLSEAQVYRHVLLPMAFRIVIPPLTSETMNLIKNSSIALTIGLMELTFRSREMGEYTFNFFEAFSAATIVYIVIAMTANRVMAWVERRTAVPGYIAGGGK
ncbi:MAG: amino acid ABC transporter permease [Betaproteobacteria bacterium]|jgi:glutamate/aspartate transport system permease protein|nr:amino acid ABC transporter permease [Betaproteobacteria bacterium]